ncbi:MAG: hypothetical protein RIT28_43 [Pseudomonadota bacterium]
MSAPFLARELYAQHRQRALAALPDGEAILLFGAAPKGRNGDSEHRYRQDSHLLYLTGWTDPEVVVVLRGGEAPNFVMFVQPKDAVMEVWTGIRPGPEGATTLYGADEAHPIAELSKRLPELLVGFHTLHVRLGVHPQDDAVLMAALSAARKPARERQRVLPDAFVSPDRLLGQLRLIKSKEELTLMREAAAITHEAHVAAMRAGKPGAKEYELEALIEYNFRARGGDGPGYASIVGSGPNACILHHVKNDRQIQDGDLVLVDAGCERQGYTADVTRTFPASGTFSPAQREIYGLVLDVQRACIDLVRPTSTFKQVSDAAIRGLTEGMVRLGLLTGDVDTLIQEKSYKRYYMHGIGHWLGLDVHDVGAYVEGQSSSPLRPGAVITIEPGIYIPPDDAECPPQYRGIGVRIEDDVLVTEGDPDVLTASIPKEISDIEAICRR